MPRTIVITGVTSGFGRATAAVFIKDCLLYTSDAADEL